MNFAIDLYSDFLSAKTLDELWGKLHLHLENFGITNVSYVITHSPKRMFEGMGIEFNEQHPAEHQNYFDERFLPADYFRTSHPDDYRQHFEERFCLTDDLTSIHAATQITPFIWHADVSWMGATERQKRFFSDAIAFGMGVGVTIPLRFSYTGAGGIGMSARNLTKVQFNTMWESSCQYITHLCYMFDEIARQQFPQDLIASLSHRECEVLARLAEGEPIKRIAAKLSISDETAATYITRARNKLKARNNTQAIIKAIQFGFIKP